MGTMGTTKMYLLQYKHYGSIRSAVFSNSMDARAWGEYCFHHVVGITGCTVTDLTTNSVTWKLGAAPSLTRVIDWNHNEREGGQ